MIALYHDYTDPGSAVAVLRLQRLADEGVQVRFEAFDVMGVDAHLPVTLDVMAAMDLLAEQARAEGLRLRRPAMLPPTARAHLIGELAQERGLGASWRVACYRAFWEQGADIDDPQTLLELAARAGMSGDEVAAALSERGRLASLRRRMAAHRGAGVGGVPTILAHRTLVDGLLDEPQLRALAALS